MAFIPYVPYEEASDRLKAVYEKMGAPGRMPANVVRVSSVNPPVMEGHSALYRSVVGSKSPLTRAQKEMIAVVVSGLNRCHYCVEHHWTALKAQAKADDSLKQALLTDFQSANISEQDKLILTFAEKITHEPHAIDQACIDFLKSHDMSDQMIHDIVQVSAYYAYVNRVAVGLGVELESE